MSEDKRTGSVYGVYGSASSSAKLPSMRLLMWALQPMIIPNAAVLPVYRQEQEGGIVGGFVELTWTS